MREIRHAQEIVDALGRGGARAHVLGEVCGVQYRLAYGYLSRNYIPARHDPKLVAALKAAGSDIDLLTLARWRSRRDCERQQKRLGPNDRAYQGDTQASQRLKSARAEGAACTPRGVAEGAR